MTWNLFCTTEGVTGFTYRNAYNDLFDDVDKYYAPFISPSINDRLKGKEIRDLLPENNNKGINLVPQILAKSGRLLYKGSKSVN
mgnify:CR=1 FL=1